MSSHTPYSLATMPDEILARIFQWAHTYEDVMRVCMTIIAAHKTLQPVWLRQYNILRYVSRLRVQHDTNVEKFLAMLRRMAREANATHMDIRFAMRHVTLVSSLPNLSADHIFDALQCMPQLASLELHLNCRLQDNIDARHPPTLVSLPSLQALCILSPFVDVAIDTLCPNLTQLELGVFATTRWDCNKERSRIALPTSITSWTIRHMLCAPFDDGCRLNLPHLKCLHIGRFEDSDGIVSLSDTLAVFSLFWNQLEELTLDLSQSYTACTVPISLPANLRVLRIHIYTDRTLTDGIDLWYVYDKIVAPSKLRIFVHVHSYYRHGRPVPAALGVLEFYGVSSQSNTSACVPSTFHANVSDTTRQHLWLLRAMVYVIQHATEHDMPTARAYMHAGHVLHGQVDDEHLDLPLPWFVNRMRYICTMTEQIATSRSTITSLSRALCNTNIGLPGWVADTELVPHVCPVLSTCSSLWYYMDPMLSYGHEIVQRIEHISMQRVQQSQITCLYHPSFMGMPDP